MNHLIPIFEKDEVGIYHTCTVSGEHLHESELYFDNMSGEYFKPSLVDEYLKGLTGIEKLKLKQILLNENKPKNQNHEFIKQLK